MNSKGKDLFATFTIIIVLIVALFVKQYLGFEVIQ